MGRGGKKAALATPAFQVYPADELSDARLLVMTNEQVGIYFKLWLICWREFSIPSSPALLGLMCSESPAKMKKLLPEILRYFEPDKKNPERLIHPGHEKERLKQAKFKAAKALAGRKGGKVTQSKLAASKASSTASSKAQADRENLLQAKRSFSSSSSFSSSDSLSPNPSRGEERESDAIGEPEARMLLRAEIGAIFKRHPKRPWSKVELECLEALGEITKEEVTLLKRFYAANIEAKKDRRRHNLESLLRNWSGELDKAQGYFAAQQRKDYAL